MWALLRFPRFRGATLRLSTKQSRRPRRKSNPDFLLGGLIPPRVDIVREGSPLVKQRNSA